MILTLPRPILPGIITLLVVLATACAVAPSVETLRDTLWAARRAELDALRDWTVAGRMAVIDNQDGWHASLHWTQREDAYSMELIGPLGQGRIRIEGDQDQVRVRTADGQVFADVDPGRLLERAVGVRIPVEGLIYWIRGLPDPSQPSVLRGDQQGRLLRIEQDGWIIEYPGYMQVAHLQLPAQIRARRGELSFKLIVKDWDLPTRPRVTALPAREPG